MPGIDEKITEALRNNDIALAVGTLCGELVAQLEDYRRLIFGMDNIRMENKTPYITPPEESEELELIDREGEEDADL